MVVLCELIASMVSEVCINSCERMGIGESGEMRRDGGFSGCPVISVLVLTFPSCSESHLFSQVWGCLGVFGGVCGLWSMGARFAFACV